MIREANYEDLDELLHLYLFLHETSIPEANEQLLETWQNIITDKNHHIIVYELDQKIVSSCVCVIIPNLTRGGRPYALIENVVTHQNYRRRAYAEQCLNYAKTIALEHNCYKLMLLTGSNNANSAQLYTKAGYNSTDKTAFIQWLNV